MYWTIQHQSILDIFFEQGEYEPDFSLSPVSEYMRGPYSFVLNHFNALNPTLGKHKGLIFCFDDTPEHRLSSLDDVEDFLSSKMRWDFIRKLGINDDMFESGEYSLLLLDNYPQDMFTLPIDTSYFVELGGYLDSEGNMIPSDSQVEDLIARLGNNWREGNRFYGWMLPSTVAGIASSPSNIMQYHLPYIHKENLVMSISLKKALEQ